MTLKQIKDFFKSTIGWTDGISIEKIDKNLEKAVCFYNSRHPTAKIGAVGGKENKSYDFKSITILLRWTTNADEAEKKAEEIYNFFDEKTFIHDKKRVFVISRFENPIDLGTDERGVYEYSFEFDLYSEKIKEEE